MLPSYDIVLLGAGHTHLHIVRQWGMRPLAEARLTLVSDFYVSTYSGMLPGTLAKLYEPAEMTIDLVRYCAARGVRLIRGRVVGHDRGSQRLLMEDRPAIPYDWLSVGVGSLPRWPAGADSDTSAAVVPIKPMQTFLPRLDKRLRQLGPERQVVRVVVVGGGAGGSEIAMCLPSFLASRGRQTELTLVDRGSRLCLGLPQKTSRRVREVITHRGGMVLLNEQVAGFSDAGVQLESGSTLPADLMILATGAAAPPVLSALELPLDERGFLLTRGTLQSTGHERVFAVGDCGSLVDQKVPKAGVYAVRQGPVLWENLRRALAGETLQEFEPQRGFLSLLCTGQNARGRGEAILSYRGLVTQGELCWRAKDYIDRRFLRMYQPSEPAAGNSPAPMAAAAMPRPTGPMPNNTVPTMRCHGCGGKIAADVLRRALARLRGSADPDVLVGLDRPGDVAVLRWPDAAPVAMTADFFAAFVDDPYLVGRVAALHAASDVLASGARPRAALALVTLPVGSPRQQEEMLYQTLAGGERELAALGATLVGGHTIEGAVLTVGFCLIGSGGERVLRSKGGLQPGDALVLTRPLGTGVLLAALAQARLEAPAYAALEQALLTSNASAAAVCHRFSVHAMTDVTGFGLAGHLLEMLAAGGVGATLDLSQVAYLPGACELASAGVESSLAPANRRVEPAFEAAAPLKADPRYALLFDPQTSGGLLAGIPPDQAAELLSELGKAGIDARVIGAVRAGPVQVQIL